MAIARGYVQDEHRRYSYGTVSSGQYVLGIDEMWRRVGKRQEGWVGY